MYINESLFFSICGKFTLSKKKGHVAPKCVSANNKIVININWVSNPGNKYNILKYKIGKIIGNLRTPLDQSRSRQLGGTSNLWGGWSIPLESYDFNTWPIKEKSLQNFNLRTCEILKIKNQFRKSKLDKFFNQIEFQYSNVRFADDYENQLTISKYINIFLNTQLTHFVGSNKKTSHAICVSNGKRYKINSKYFILACGGIENSRILLWTKEKSPSLIDNNLPIGKYWMTHPWIIGGIGVITKHEIVLAITGGLFVLEGVSVIVQVISYKLTGKRIFKMAPIHHHFEKKGWAESTVVVRFWIISIILAMIGLATLKLR